MKKKRNQINILVNPDEVAAWRAQATKEHRDLSSWIRIICTTYCMGKHAEDFLYMQLPQKDKETS